MIYFLLGSGYSAMEIFAVMLAFFIAVCVAMTVHEWAHAYSAHKCGDDTARLAGRMTLNPFAHFTTGGLICFLLIGFGWAKPVPINPAKFRNYKKNSVWVITSGVLANFILAFLFAGLMVFFGGSLFVEYITNSSLLCFFLYNLLSFCLTLNIVLFIFNLLPIPPLDGFNLISLLTKWDNKFVAFMSKYGFYFLIALIIPFIPNGSGLSSILGLFYQYVIPLFEGYFGFFWGLFV